MLKKILNFIKKDDFLKASSIVFVGSFIGNLLNYIYQIIMGRMLGPADYGVFGSLLGILLVLQVTGGSFEKVISKFTAKYSANQELSKVKYLLFHAFKKFIVYGLLALLIFFFFVPQISSFLNIASPIPIILVGILGYITLLGTIVNGTLNGLQKFKAQMIFGNISTVLKLILGIFFVYLGFGVKGAFFGLILSGTIGILLRFLPLLNILKLSSTNLNKKEIYKYIWPVLFASTALILMTNLDVILVKHFFSSSMTGYYVAASTIGKIIFFATSFLVIVMFPKISSEHAKKADTFKILRPALIYTSIFAGAGVFLYYLIPNFIINTMYGPSYKLAVPLLGLLGIAYALFSLSNVLVLYNLAIERYNVVYFILVGVLVLVSGIFSFHNNLIDVLKVLVVSNLLVFLLCLNYAGQDIF